MTNTTIPAGYKQTEVGVIPEDWEMTKLGSISLAVSSGGTPSRDNPLYWDGDIPWITTSQINFGEITEAEQFITQQGLQFSSAKMIDKGALLIAMYGQGKTRGKVGVLQINATINQACAAVRLNDKVVHRFVYHYLVNQYEYIRALSNSGGQENLSGFIVKMIPIVLPPTKEEQTSIASALSDMDALLDGLDRLITKKRNLKQAAMQQLLTGKTRLAGFEGEWEVDILGSYVEALISGTSVNSTDDKSTIGNPCVLKTSALSNGVFLSDEVKLITAKDLSRAKTTIKNNTILISRMNTPDLVGEIAYIDQDYPLLFLPDRIWMTKFHGDTTINVRWLAYILSSPEYKKQLKASATGTSGSMKNISKDKLLSLEIKFPNVEEQKAIAAVLSDMDAEIAALEQRRTKTRDIKQGMMQELLTGRTRLV